MRNGHGKMEQWFDCTSILPYRIGLFNMGGSKVLARVCVEAAQPHFPFCNIAAAAVSCFVDIMIWSLVFAKTPQGGRLFVGFINAKAHDDDADDDDVLLSSSTETSLSSVWFIHTEVLQQKKQELS